MKIGNLDRKGWQARLEKEERELGFSEGFKLLYCPWATLGHADVAFLSLNPGAKVPDRAELRVVSDERGNSYEVEQATTRSPITAQFLAFAAMVGAQPRDILTGVAAPFRSDRWASLSAHQKRASLGIGAEFWRDAFATRPPHRILACGADAARFLTELTGAVIEDEFLSGWGEIKLRTYRMPTGGALLETPHLSQFKLFSRPACVAPLARLLGSND